MMHGRKNIKSKILFYIMSLQLAFAFIPINNLKFSSRITSDFNLYTASLNGPISMSSARSSDKGATFIVEVKQYWGLNISVQGHLFGCVQTGVKKNFSKGMTIYILFLVF